MPYSIRPKDDKFQVVNTDTGKVHGTHDTRERAERQLRLLRAIEHNPDWQPRKK